METPTHEINVNDSVGKDLLTDLPLELTKSIFQYLSAVDLSRVASCNRHLRSVANLDSIWRPLCMRNGWERYDNITDLTKEIPYKPQDVSGGRNDVSFNMAAIVGQDSTTNLVATCRWKEIYMKANHLENNWKNKRFHVSTLSLDIKCSWRIHVVIDKDSLVIRLLDDTIQIWDIKAETCRHLIPAISEGVECLSVSNGKVAVGSKNDLIRIFSTKTGEILHVMRETREEQTDQTLFIDTELVISAAIPYRVPNDVPNSRIYVWTVEDGALRHTFKIDVEGAILRAVDYRDKMVVGAYSDKCLRLWDAVTGDCLHTLRYNCEGIAESLSCCLGNGIIALANFNGMKFMIWNIQSGECVTSVSIHGDFEYLNHLGLVGKCEAVEDLLIVSLYPDECIWTNVYDQKGEVLKNLKNQNGRMYCHGNKIVFHGSEEIFNDCDNVVIYMVVSRYSKQMRIGITDERKTRLHGIDDTKMVLSDDYDVNSSLKIYHYW